MTGEPWFRPKRYGYGATPSNWKGWTFLAAMILILAAMGLGLLPDHGPIYWAGLALWLVVTLTVTAVKGGGSWRWRWGERETGER